MEWNRLALGGAAGVMVLMTGCASSQTETQISALEKSNQEILARLDRLDEEKSSSVPIADIFEIYMDRNTISPILWKKYLDGLVLPENPSEAQIIAYFEKLYNLRHFSWNSDNVIGLQEAKILAVGRNELPRMLQYMDSQAFQRAVGRLVTAQDKELLVNEIKKGDQRQHILNLVLPFLDESDSVWVLANLQSQPHLINAVQRLGLEKKALPIIVEQFTKRSGRFNYSQIWAQVAMSNLEGKAKQDFMEAYWKRLIASSNGYPANIAEQALQMARIGFLPAFEFLVKSATQLQQYNRHQYDQIMPLARMSDGEVLTQWFERNRGKIVFDPEKNVFVAQENSK